MPLRRRRDRAPIQARTEEQSPARVRVPARQKAPRSLRRCCPSRGGIRGGSRPDRRVERDSRPHDESSRRQGCPERYEEGTRESSKNARRLCSGAPAHGLSRPRKWNVACEEPSRTDRGSQVPGAATHRAQAGAWRVEVRRSPVRRRIVDQRNRHRLVPASSGAKAPLACEDRTLVGCARASFSGCRSRQATPRFREACLPLAAGRVDGDLALESPQGLWGAKRRREPESRWPSCEAGELRSRALERASRGKGSCSMEGISDHPFSSHRSCDRADGGLGSSHGCARRASDMTTVGEATGMPEVRTARIATGRQRPPR